MCCKMLCDMQLQGSSNSSVVAEENGKGRTNGVPKVSIKVEPQDGMPQVGVIVHRPAFNP